LKLRPLKLPRLLKLLRPLKLLRLLKLLRPLKLLRLLTPLLLRHQPLSNELRLLPHQKGVLRHPFFMPVIWRNTCPALAVPV